MLQNNLEANQAKIVEAPLIIPEGDYDVSNITYDANGNIQTLNRNGYTGGGSNAMDNFTYNYKPKTNQLPAAARIPRCRTNLSCGHKEK